METYASFPRVEVGSYFGRGEETPCVLVALEDVVIGTHLGIGGSHFHGYIGLKLAVVETVVRQGTEGDLKEGVLLVGIERSTTHVEGCAGEVLVVGVIAQKSAKCQFGGYVVSHLEIHAPSACIVGKVVAQWDVELLIDVVVGIL